MKKSSAKTNGLSKLKSALFYAVIVLFVAALTFLIQYFLSKKNSDSVPFNENSKILEITVLDVGNADSILIECSGEVMLIDAGENNDEDKIVRFLKQKSIKKIDKVIATHPDADHIGGMDAVIKSFEIHKFYMPILPDFLTPTTATYVNMLNALDEENIAVFEGLKGEVFNLGSVKAEFLWPEKGLSDSNNNFSIVVLLTFENNRFLFMGDAEKETENALLESGINLRADFLKVGHHGSKTSSTEKFIKAVSPKYCAVTSGLNNRYGHPHSDVLTRLADHRINVFRSDVHGDITVKSDGNSIVITTEK